MEVELASVGGKPVALHECAFDQRLNAYRIAKAEMDMQIARDELSGEDNTGAVMDHLSATHTDALDVLLMTPARDQRELWHKIDIIVREEVHDNWHLANEIMGLLRCDADRLLDRSRKMVPVSTSLWG